MISVADIFEKPKIVLFTKGNNDKFYVFCQKREKELKDEIQIALFHFNTHVTILNKSRSELAKWKVTRIGECIYNIGDYIEHLVEELDRPKIEHYCNAMIQHDSDLPIIKDIVLLMTNSYYSAIEIDLHWIYDLPMIDSLKISEGDFNYDLLKDYLPKRFVEVESLIQQLNNTYVNTYAASFFEAKNSFVAGYTKGSSLLLLTIIEGLVRCLGVDLVKKQKLTIDPQDKRKYASLESFINKIPWKKDLKISYIKYGLLTGNIALYKSSNQEEIFVNLKDRVGFLCRRYKENRNTILHGEKKEYGDTLNSFLNFSALKEVLLTIQEYSHVYTNQMDEASIETSKVK
ncbi:MAG: hypothetical protein WC716_07010 [Chitinophagaceae bacterium]|jgi:hypothetical protein